MGAIWAVRPVAGKAVGGICTHLWGCGLQSYLESQGHASGLTPRGRDVISKSRWISGWERGAPGVCPGRDAESRGCCPTRDAESRG